MAKLSRPRYGSLQFYPRKRIDKFLPSVNWSAVGSEVEGLQGFIVYKAAMASAVVKDMTDKSMTQNKKIVIPVTILEVPHMKIFSIRFYKSGDVIGEVVVSNDKELKRKLKVPKQIKDFESIKKDFVDVRGLTKGKGLQGPLTRFGLSLKAHKSEKGRRRPGSLAPWHPARVTFRTPMAGQMGLFSRIQYNLKLLATNSIADKNINPGTGFQHYGNIQSNYMIVLGSLAGPVKRAVLLTPAFRPSKNMTRKKYELVEVLK